MFNRNNLSKFVAILAIVFGVSISAACDKSTTQDVAAETPPESTTPAQETEKTKGKKHDPPIAITAVPDGHWYCDMGTSHYTTSEKPADGKCPLCGMKLVEKTKKTADTEDTHDHKH